MVDYVADYLDNIRDRKVVPDVKPGYIRDVVPERAPEQGEAWQAVMADLDKVVMSGVTHWHHPQFHAYFPTARSWSGKNGGLLLSPGPLQRGAGRYVSWS